jgi:transcriptional regulator with XRE-family HTH domain
MESFKKIFTKNLKSVRESKNLSQKEISEKLEIPPSTYANWEQGRREPGIDEIHNILKVLEIDANELFSMD